MKVISKENGNYVIREQQEESPLVTIVKGIIMLGALAYAYVVLGGMMLWDAQGKLIILSEKGSIQPITGLDIHLIYKSYWKLKGSEQY